MVIIVGALLGDELMCDGEKHVKFGHKKINIHVVRSQSVIHS